MLLRLGGHAVPAGNLPNFNSVGGRAIVGHEFFQRSADLRFNLGIVRHTFGDHSLFHEQHDVVERDRRLRRVNNRFKFCFKTHV